MRFTIKMFTFIKPLAVVVVIGSLMACEGSKSRPLVACNSGYVDHLGRCSGGSDQNVGRGCNIGYHKQNGVCVANELECEVGQHQQGDACVADDLSLEIVSRTACWIPETAVTRLVMQFIARDEEGSAIDPGLDDALNPTLLSSELFVNGRPRDVESKLVRDAELLKSDLVLSLVLDSSYSMLEQNPPAFEPMKSAAIEILQDAQQTWGENDSSFHWELAWFNRYLFRPLDHDNGQPWLIEDIAHIPEPQMDSYTALYFAAYSMASVHQKLYNDGLATGSRDQHVMIILSDGEDNYSYHNIDHMVENNNGLIHWTEIGTQDVNDADVDMAFASVPNLRVHVIGLGSGVDREQLERLASVGKGQVFFGDGGDTVAGLFNEVKRELVTQQTLGVEMPLQPDSYEFSLRAKHLLSGAQGSHTFTLDVGNEVLDECGE